jgi:UDP-N-acetylmuramate dehydrogenase
MTKDASGQDWPRHRGRLIEGAVLAPFTWLRVGGPADVLFIPEDVADLCVFLAGLPEDVPVFPMGAASNLIVRDGGIRGIVVKLGAGFGKVVIEGRKVRAGAAALDKMVAKAAQKEGLTGLEFFVGVPGTIGGAIRMNAGCYGHETRDRLIRVTGVDRQGRIVELMPDDLHFAYRHCEAPDDMIFVEAIFEAERGEPERIAARMAEITAAREASQPIKERTGGSTFANPDAPGTPDQRKAWQLIDSVGGRGARLGGAIFSPQHCNFLINSGDATAADLESLGEEMRARVRAAHGIDLRWEVKRVGEPL